MIVFDYSSENLISILGALFDITGAAFLAWALVFVKARAIIRQSSSGYGFTPTLVKMFSEQKIDAAFGLVFLMIGFILQGGRRVWVQIHELCTVRSGSSCPNQRRDSLSALTRPFN
jgi:hypothetical protein